MITGFEGSLFTSFTPLVFITCAAAMVVLRAGASRVFFDIVGTFQATQMIKDMKAAETIFSALYLDAIAGIQEAGQEIGDQFTNLLDSVIPVTEEIGEATIELEKFLNLGEAQATSLKNEIRGIGLEYAFAADEAYMAGARMAQLGGVLGEDTIGTGTKIGMEFGLISGMNTEAAMQRMINLQQQTRFMTENLEDNMSAEQRANQIRLDSIKVLDQLNTIENRSAATMEQITYVMNQFASQAILANESIAAMAAMSATLIEAGEEQGKGGRALRMMYARLGGNINGAADALHELGINTRDTEGNMRPLSHIINELAGQFETMSDGRKMDIAQAVAGNRHYTRFLKLVQNNTRAKELEMEAMLGLFPAMDEVHRRQETVLFQYQESEAAVKNYSAALGEELMPAMTEVNNKQAMLTKNLAAMAESGGGVTTSVLAMTEGLKRFAGPTVAMLINLKNMQISMQTHAAIQRSLAGEDIAGKVTFNKFSTSSQEAAKNVGAFNFALEAVDRQIKSDSLPNLKNMAILTDEESFAIRMNIAALGGLSNARIHHAADERDAQKEKVLQLEKSINTTEIKIEKDKENIAAMKENGEATEKATEALNLLIEAKEKYARQAIAHRGHITRQNKEMEQAKKDYEKAHKEKDKLVASEMRQIDEDQRKHETDIEMAKESARAMNQRTIQLSALGTGLMLVSDNEKAMRMGMVLNAMAMSIQIYKTITSVGVKKMEAQATREQAAMEASLTAAKTTGTAATIAATAATRTFATTVATGARAVKAAAPELIALAAAAWVVTEALEWLGVFDIKDQMGDLGVVANLAATDMEMVYDILTDLGDAEDPIQSVTDKIQEQDTIINTLGETATGANKIMRDEAIKTRGIYEETLRILETPNLDTNPAQAWFDTNEQEESIDGYWKKFLKGEKWMGETIERTGKLKYLNVGYWYEEAYNQMGVFNPLDQIQKDRDEFMKNYPELYEYIDKYAITDINHLEEHLAMSGMVIGDFMDTHKDKQEAISSALASSMEEIYKFNTAREELFYGFSSDRLTGDLVRQVTQQGVETLITTTEVIMSNNFNGMTTSQAAEQILDEIERGATLRGYILKPS